MKKLIISLILFIGTLSQAADLNVSCRPPFSQNIERLDVIKKDNRFTVSFDFKIAEGFTCVDSETQPDFKGVAKCSSTQGQSIEILTTETGFTDGTLVMDADHVSGIICFHLKETGT